MRGSFVLGLVLVLFVSLTVGSDLVYPPYGTAEILYNAHTSTTLTALSTPIDVFSSGGALHITLTTQVYRSSSDVFSFNTRAFCFNQVCSVPGPTLHLQPGDELRVTIINQLGDDLLSVSGFRNSNHTNMEVYGVRFDSTPVTSLYSTASNTGLQSLLTGTSAGHGQTLTYSAAVSADHAPGTHWYHSNVPGSSALQVMGGLFGAVVVDPEPGYASALSSIVPLKQHLIVLSHVMLENAAGGAPTDSSSTAWSLARLAAVAGSTLPLSPQYNTSANVTIKDSWFANGQYQPNIALTTGEWHLLDIVVASGDRLVELEIRTSFLSSAAADECSMKLLALDGVYLTAAREVTHLPLLQGSRAAIAVQCTAVGTYYLISASAVNIRSPYFPVGTLETKSAQVLLSLSALSGAAPATSPSFDLSSIPRPSYLTSVLASSLPDSVARQWSISTAQAGCCGAFSTSSCVNCNPLYWLGVGTNCTLPCLSEITCGLLYGAANTVADLPSVSNGMCAYSNNASSSVVTALEEGGVTTIRGSELQEISLWGVSSAPFTMQLRGVHFQIGGYDNTNLDSHYDGANELDTAPDLGLLYGQIGDFRDTWPALAGKVTLRVLLPSTGSGVTASVSTTMLRYRDRGMVAEVALSTALTAAPAPSANQTDPAPQPTTAPPLESNTTSNSTAPPPTDPFSLAVARSLAAAVAAQSAAIAELQRLQGMSPVPQLYPLEGHQTIIQFRDNQTLAIVTELLPGMPPNIEMLPVSGGDSFVTALALDPEADTVYFATEYGIFKVQASSSGGGAVVPIVAGLLSVTLVGFNLGADTGADYNPAALITVTVRGLPCTSLRLTDTLPPANGLPLPSYLTTLTCLVYSPGGDSTVSPSDVTISVAGGGGSTTGAPSDIQPFASVASLNAIRSGAGSRPTLLSVELSLLPFKPKALFLLQSGDSFSRTPKYLYWTNADDSTGSSILYRCLPDGQRIETVFTQGREAPLGLLVLSVPLSDFTAATGPNRAKELLAYRTSTAARVGRGRRTLVKKQAAQAISGSTVEYVDLIFFTQTSVSDDGSISLLSFAASSSLDASRPLYSGNRSSSQPSLVQPSEIVPVTVLPMGSNMMSIPTAITADKDLNDGFLFLSLLDGTVLRIEMAFLLSQPAFPSSSPFWVGHLSGPRSSSRVTSLYSTPGDTQAQRVFSIDSNMRVLVACSQGGSCSTVDLLSTGILWPSAVSGSGSVNATDRGSVTVYLAEALGRIWRVDLSRSLSADGSFDRSVTASRVVADISSYPSSIRIRGLLQTAGPQESSSSQITFETVY